MSGIAKSAAALCAAVLLILGTAIAQETVLYNFNDNNGDGYDPLAGLTLDHSGNLYGTTFSGGAFGSGAVYELSPSDSGWTETILYSFGSYADDGFWVSGGVIMDASGNLYGTTQFGGVQGKGLVYELSPSAGGGWTQTALFNFAGPNGAQPLAGLTFDAAGNLYGTAASGGPYSAGSVFKLAPNGDGSWTLTTLHDFGGNAEDGAGPLGGVILDSAGNIYGATQSGGGGASGCAHGCGVVYELTFTGGHWAETILHNFNKKTTDGQLPQGSLVMDGSGNLYGTATQGGSEAGGIVYELIPSGKTWQEKVLHAFHPGRKDGYSPQGGVAMDAKGNLYGTTLLGGAHSQGTVYEVSAGSSGTWTESVVHSFANSKTGSDGESPIAGVVLDSAGNIYGTTGSGGTYSSGTVFEIAP